MTNVKLTILKTEINLSPFPHPRHLIFECLNSNHYFSDKGGFWVELDHIPTFVADKLTINTNGLKFDN